MLEDIDLTTLTVLELDTLEKDIAAEKSRRIDAGIKSAREKILSLAAETGRSVEEILSLTAKPKRREPADIVVRFRNTANANETWSGRGKRPRWLQEALRGGAELSDFAVGEAA